MSYAGNYRDCSLEKLTGKKNDFGLFRLKQYKRRVRTGSGFVKGFGGEIGVIVKGCGRLVGTGAVIAVNGVSLAVPDNDRATGFIAGIEIEGSAGGRVRWRCGTTAAPSTIRSTTTPANAGSCTGPPSRATAPPEPPATAGHQDISDFLPKVLNNEP